MGHSSLLASVFIPKLTSNQPKGHGGDSGSRVIRRMSPLIIADLSWQRLGKAATFEAHGLELGSSSVILPFIPYNCPEGLPWAEAGNSTG